MKFEVNLKARIDLKKFINKLIFLYIKDIIYHGFSTKMRAFRFLKNTYIQKNLRVLPKVFALSSLFLLKQYYSSFECD